MSRLQAILDVCKQQLDQDRAACSEDGLRAKYRPRYPVTWQPPRSTVRPQIFTEFKRTSPSRATPQHPPPELLPQITRYLEGGACGISVLTEPHFFQGSLEDLQAARHLIDQWCAAHPASPQPPLLQKGFLWTPYQILQGHLSGADLPLLIVALLELVWPDPLESTRQLRRLLIYARRLGMEPLVEVHTRPETDIALDAGARLIGINTRNLHTFGVNPDSPLPLLDHLARYPHVRTLVLSGIASREDMTPYLQRGAQGFLIGSHLMQHPSPLRRLAYLTRQSPLVKICGITSPQEVAYCSGAHLLGLVFAPSKRRITLRQAQKISEALQEGKDSKESKEGKEGKADEPTPSFPYETYLDPHEAHLAHITERARQNPRPLLVGVFTDQSTDWILHIAETVPLDLVQLHGTVKPEDFGEAYREGQLWTPAGTSCHLLQAWSIPHDAQALPKLQVPAIAPLFDTIKSSTPNTPSRCFPHKLLVPYNDRFAFGVAGGLTPDNIGEVIDMLVPWLVDLSSGVEKPLEGGKCPTRLAALFETV